MSLDVAITCATFHKYRSTLYDDLLSDFIWANGFLFLRFAFAKADAGVVAVYR